MSTEHEKELETNALASRLTTGWEKFKKGQLVSYRVMALTLIAVTAVGLFLYIRHGKKNEASAKWVEVESANTLDTLDELAKKNPNTTVGNVARLHAARYRLGNVGIEGLSTRDAALQKKAVENIEAARDTFEELVGAFKNDPVNKAQSLLGRAKAEAALIGMFKDAMTGEQRGTVAKLIEWLDKLAAEADGTPWGEDAKKYAAALKNAPTAEELTRVQRGLYTIEKLPDVPPGFKPKSPGDLPPTGTLPVIPGGSDPKKEPAPIAPGEKPAEKKDEKAAPPKTEPPKTPEPAPKPPEKKP